MQWDKSLECNIVTVDHEHKELFRQVDCLMQEPNAERVQEMLSFLAGYVVKHFAHEQLMHKRSAYPKAAEHKTIHESFVATFVELEKEYTEQGGTPEVLEKIIAAVTTWLKEHIMGEDKEFAEYYRNLRDKDSQRLLAPM